MKKRFTRRVRDTGSREQFTPAKLASLQSKLLVDLEFICSPLLGSAGPPLTIRG